MPACPLPRKHPAPKSSGRSAAPASLTKPAKAKPVKAKPVKAKPATPRSTRANPRQLAKPLPVSTAYRHHIISISDVCRLLDVTRPPVYRLIRLGQLALHMTDGKPTRFNGQVAITLASWNSYRTRHSV